MEKNVLSVAGADAKTDQCFSKERLRDQFRMKRKADANPVAHYKNRFGVKFPVFRIADCLPIRETQLVQASAKQQRARAILAVKARLRSNRARVSSVAATWLEASPLFLDTETTGLGNNAQIIEISISDANGRVLLNTRLRPTVSIEPVAQAIHCIDAESLEAAPVWSDISHQVKELLRGQTVVIFNADFDSRMVRQTAAAFGESVD